MASEIFDGDACDYLLSDRGYDSDSFVINIKNHLGYGSYSQQKN
jgi:hypothetical protein